MAIPIIGASDPRPEAVLSIPEISLPEPESAPAAEGVLSESTLRPLLSHENPMVRSFALEQIEHLNEETWDDAVLKLVDDEDPRVAAEAISTVEARKIQSAVVAILKRFGSQEPEVAGAAAEALGTLAPDQLLEAVRSRGRLDDETYLATLISLGTSGSDEAQTYLSKALDRSGALAGERKRILFLACLLSGEAQLIGRVLGFAISESKESSTKDPAARIALSMVAGLTPGLYDSKKGAVAFNATTERLVGIIPALMGPDEVDFIEKALKQRNIQDILGGLSNIALKEGKKPQTPTLERIASLAKRRQALLDALVKRSEAIGDLGFDAGALFLSVATEAIYAMAPYFEPETGALEKLSKLLDLELQDLTSPPFAKVTQAIKKKGERQLRPVLRMLVEGLDKKDLEEHLVLTIVEEGHSQQILENLCEAEDPAVIKSVLDVMAKSPERTETAVLTLLGASPLEEDAVAVALLTAQRLRTKRIALAIGRRYWQLRPIARSLLARTMLRLGDPSLLPLLKSRAYREEPEELAWVILSLVHGEPMESQLEDALNRTMKKRRGEEPDDQLQVTLLCERCQEKLSYRFERALVDAQSKDPSGDPAFVGPVVCKACGGQDTLKATSEAARVLTGHMLEFLSRAKMGQPGPQPLVMPATTMLGGKSIGMAAAFRQLTEEIATSPDAIRPRLHRARLGLVLKRPNVQDDVDAALRIDPESVEAKALQAAWLIRTQDPKTAMTVVADALRAFLREPAPRIYDVAASEALQENLEDYIVELEKSGIEPPSDLPLAAARARLSTAVEEPPSPPRPQDAPKREPSKRTPGRNDPCHCGSKKKYKKCHGKRASSG